MGKSPAFTIYRDEKGYVILKTLKRKTSVVAYLNPETVSLGKEENRERILKKISLNYARYLSGRR